MQEPANFIAIGPVIEKAKSFDRLIQTVKQQQEQTEKILALAKADIEELEEYRAEIITIIQNCHVKIAEIANQEPGLKEERLIEELRKVIKNHQDVWKKKSDFLLNAQEGRRKAEREKTKLDHQLTQLEQQKLEITSKPRNDAKKSAIMLEDDLDDVQPRSNDCSDEHTNEFNEFEHKCEALKKQLSKIERKITGYIQQISDIWLQEQELLQQQSERQCRILNDYRKQYENEPDIIKTIRLELDKMDEAVAKYAKLQSRLKTKLGGLKRKQQEQEQLKRQAVQEAVDDNDIIDDNDNDAVSNYQAALSTSEKFLATKIATREETLAQLPDSIRRPIEELKKTRTLRIIVPETDRAKSSSVVQKVIQAAREYANFVKQIDFSHLNALNQPEVLETLVNLFKHPQCQLKRVSLAYIGLTGSQLAPLLKALADKPLVYLNIAGNNVGQDGHDAHRSQSSHRRRHSHSGMRALVALVQGTYQQTGKQLELIVDENKLSDRAMEIFCDGLQSHHIIPKLVSLLDTDISNAALSLLLKTAKAGSEENNNKYFYLKISKLVFNDDNVEQLVKLAFNRFHFYFGYCNFTVAQIRLLLIHMANFVGESYRIFSPSGINISSANLDAFIQAIQNQRVAGFGFNFKELNSRQTTAVLEAVNKADYIDSPVFDNLTINRQNLRILCNIFTRSNLSTISVKFSQGKGKELLDVDSLVTTWCSNSQFASLQFIELFGSNCYISVDAFKLLANKRSNARELSLVGVNITDGYLQQHADALAKNYPDITILNLANNQISRIGLIALLAAFENHEQLEVLWLGNNHLIAEDAPVVYHATTNRRLLDTLTCKPSLIDLKGADTSLTKFRQALIKAINQGRRRSEPPPSSVGMQGSFFNSPKRDSLSFKRRELSALDLATELKNAPKQYSQITKLDLSNNPELLSGISPKAIEKNYNKLAEILLGFPLLEVVHLDGLNLNDKYISPIITALKQLPNLVEISLNNTNLCKDTMRTLQAITKASGHRSPNI